MCVYVFGCVGMHSLCLVRDAENCIIIQLMKVVKPKAVVSCYGLVRILLKESPSETSELIVNYCCDCYQPFFSPYDST